MSDRIARLILDLCRERGAGKTLCPSEVARALAGGEAEWRSLMAEVRRVAAALARDGLIVVTQRGKAVDIEGARGPVRLALADHTRGATVRRRSARQRSEQ